MQHALIIEEDVVFSSIVEEKLSDYGFTSFSHAWSEDDAARAARSRRPDLVIVCDRADGDSGIRAASSIAECYGVPALLVTGQSASRKVPLSANSVIGGPFLLRELSSDIRAARIPFDKNGAHVKQRPLSATSSRPGQVAILILAIAFAGAASLCALIRILPTDGVGLVVGYEGNG